MSASRFRAISRHLLVLASGLTVGGHPPALEGPAPGGSAWRGNADVHFHLTMRKAVPIFQGRPDGPYLASSPDQRWTNQVTSDGLRAAGIEVIIATVWPPFDLLGALAARGVPRQSLESAADRVLRLFERVEARGSATPSRPHLVGSAGRTR